MKKKYPSFEHSMITYDKDYSKEWEKLKDLYKKNFLTENGNDNYKKIPKIIHQIWFGSELPDSYRKFADTWKKYHPDWKYILWTDENVKSENLINYNIFNKVENFGAKSDIFRYEILNKYGGLYVDTDFVCLKSFDELNNKLEFYTGVFDHSEFVIPNGLIACVKNHPILQDIIKRLSVLNIDNNELQNPENLMKAVGPGFYTESVMTFLGSDVESKIVVFPSTYFYPSPNTVRARGLDYMNKYIKSESFAIHYWEVSWVKNIIQYKKSLFKRVIRKILKYFKLH